MLINFWKIFRNRRISLHRKTYFIFSCNLDVNIFRYLKVERYLKKRDKKQLFLTIFSTISLCRFKTFSSFFSMLCRKKFYIFYMQKIFSDFWPRNFYSHLKFQKILKNPNFPEKMDFFGKKSYIFIKNNNFGISKRKLYST